MAKEFNTKTMKSYMTNRTSVVQSLFNCHAVTKLSSPNFSKKQILELGLLITHAGVVAGVVAGVAQLASSE